MNETTLELATETLNSNATTTLEEIWTEADEEHAAKQPVTTRSLQQDQPLKNPATRPTPRTSPTPDERVRYAFD